MCLLAGCKGNVPQSFCEDKIRNNIWNYKKFKCNCNYLIFSYVGDVGERRRYVVKNVGDVGVKM